MASVDIVIAIIVLLSALIGLVRGLLREVVSLATWLAAFILALYFAPALAERLVAQISDETVRLVVGFIAVFVATLIAGALVQWLLSKLVQGTGLTGTDRFLGFLFGSARGVLVCIIALIALRPFAEDTPWWQASRLVPELLFFERDVLDLMGRTSSWLTRVAE
ncbi:MAG: CvpA family protein [Pseudomonadales bacterium]